MGAHVYYIVGCIDYLYYGGYEMIIPILLFINTMVWILAGIQPLVIFSLVLQILWLFISIKEGF